MSSIKAPLTGDEFSILILPEDDSFDLDIFLDLRQLQFIDNLHVVMRQFWMLEPYYYGAMPGVLNYHATPSILECVLDRLKEAEAGRDGPLLGCLKLEVLFGMSPDGRNVIGWRNDVLIVRRVSLATPASREWNGATLPTPVV